MLMCNRDFVKWHRKTMFFIFYFAPVGPLWGRLILKLTACIPLIYVYMCSLFKESCEKWHHFYKITLCFHGAGVVVE